MRLTALPRIVAGISGLLIISQAGGQCGSSWTSGPAPAVNGVNGPIYASLSWDHDNSVTTPNRLVVGGEFTIAGATLANNIAMWTGTTWLAFGLGTNDAVRAMTVYNNQLVIGGEFTTANSVITFGIARWTGTTFAAIGGGITGGGARVNALLPDNTNLYVGGDFATAGSASASNVAEWDGSSWSAMGAGLNDAVLALDYDDGPFAGPIAGGRFEVPGGVDGGRVALWTGSMWLELGNSLLNHFGFGISRVNKLFRSNGQLYIGGRWLRCTTAPGFCYPWVPGALLPESIARLSGAVWVDQSDLGEVFDIETFNGALIAGDWINTEGWQLLGGGIIGTVYTLTVHDDDLYACGDFVSAGGIQASNIAKWNGSVWSPIAPSVPVRAMSGTGSVFAGGDFTYATPTGPASHIVRWNGTALSPLGEFPDVGQGVNGPVHAVRVVAGFIDTNIYVGGQLLTAGGGLTPAASRIARYTFDSVSPLANWSAMGAGFNNTVFAIEVHNNEVYAGGAFTASGGTVVNGIARWNAGSQTWQPLGSGVGGSVRAIASYGGHLYVGGGFTTAGGQLANGLARWDGTSWTGFVVVGVVNALAVHNGELIIGGSFLSGIGSDNIMRYDGAAFIPFGGGGTNDLVNALTSFNGDLYVGGAFVAAGGVSASRIAKWNATDGWQALGGGVNGHVYALRGSGTRLHVGGTFSSASGFNSPYWAIWQSNVAPLIAFQPQDESTTCGDTATFSVTPVGGSVTPTFQWRRNGGALSDGPQPNGSIISGATTATLFIDNARSANAGDYDVVLSNACGSTTSNAATLEVFGCGCAADINGDGQVNVDDLIAVILGWGMCPPPPAVCAADIAPVPPNGAVDVDDLIAVILAWGACP